MPWSASSAEPVAPRLRGVWRVATVLVAGGALACLSLFQLVGPERFGPLSNAQYLPLPILGLGLCVLAMAAAVSLAWPWRLAVFALAAASLFGPMGLQVHSGENGSGRVRVMSYNVKGYLAMGDDGALLRLAHEIARHDPDIILLQDAQDLSALTREAAGVFYGGRDHFEGGQYVVASRFPLHDCHLSTFEVAEDRHAFVRCAASIRGREVDVLTTHFMSPRPALESLRTGLMAAFDTSLENQNLRRLQGRTLIRELQGRARPVILGGDLNSPPASLVFRRLLRSGLRDSFAVAGFGLGYTYGHALTGGISFLRIDHVLASADIAVARAFTGGAEASPHRPVIVDLYMEPS